MLTTALLHFRRLRMVAGVFFAIAIVNSIANGQRSSDPKSPVEALAALHLKDGFEAQIVAAEPLVQSPVAIDWGPDGRLWVAEMADYPYGIDGKGKPGGRIRVLESSRHDGIYDKSTVFLDGINMPNGICVWRKGVIVTAAPEIFYAEDSKGDGKADIRRVLFTGFKAGNPQLRVNGLRWGMDGWIYCANGWSGGEPTSLQTGQKLKLDGKDIRFRPDDGAMELQSGQSEFGRDPDDFGNWFGCDNSHPLFHFALDDFYLRRNPIMPAVDAKVQVIAQANPKVFPLSKYQKRFYTDRVGYFTSGCGMTIYRDSLLFARDGTQHMFICEPAYNLVHHEIVRESGTSFTAARPNDEKDREFAASEDPWFRPVMARTGPDGALWIVDMYRYMIEHPDWLPENGKAELRQFYREGEDRGRIYRIFPKGKRPAMPPRLDQLDAAALVAAMKTSNGMQRDMAQKVIVWGADSHAVAPVRQLFSEDADPAVRLQSLETLAVLKSIDASIIGKALNDSHSAIRSAAIRLCEPLIQDTPELLDPILKLEADPDARVRVQLACSLGQWNSPKAAAALARMGSASGSDRILDAAVMSSAATHFQPLVDALAQSALSAARTGTLPSNYRPALAMAIARNDHKAMAKLLQPLCIRGGTEFRSVQFEAFAYFLDQLASHRISLQSIGADADLGAVLKDAESLLAEARRIAPRGDAGAIALLGRDGAHAAEDREILARLIKPQANPAARSAAVGALARIGDAAAAEVLMAGWPGYPPQTRGEVLNLLVGRESWAIALLKNIKAGKFARNDIDAAHRQRLNRSSSVRVRELAATVLGTDDKSRQAVIDEYDPVLKLTGDAARGAKVFAENCAVCHRKGSAGNDLGPNLDSVLAWQSDALLTAILDPNRQVEPRYLSYTATLKDGQSIFGIIATESGDSFAIKGLDAKEHVLARSAVQSLVGTGRSLMPDGLESAVNKQAMADVIAFIRSANN